MRATFRTNGQWRWRKPRSAAARWQVLQVRLPKNAYSAVRGINDKSAIMGGVLDQGLFVFPKFMVCLDCGFAGFAIAERELRPLKKFGWRLRLLDRQRKEAELKALNSGIAVTPENGTSGHCSLAALIAEFLDETKLTKKPNTLAAYRTALNCFGESCPKLYLEDLNRSDLLKFAAFLRDEKELHPRTVYNKFENVMSFLKT